MKHYKVGQAVWIKNRKRMGIVNQVDNKGQIQKVEIEGEIFSVIGLIIEALSIFKIIWLSIKTIFRKDE